LQAAAARRRNLASKRAFTRSTGPHRGSGVRRSSGDGRGSNTTTPRLFPMRDAGGISDDRPHEHRVLAHEMTMKHGADVRDRQAGSGKTNHLMHHLGIRSCVLRRNMRSISDSPSIVVQEDARRARSRIPR